MAREVWSLRQAAEAVAAADWETSAIKKLEWPPQANEHGRFTVCPPNSWRDSHRLRHFAFAPDEVERAEIAAPVC